MATRGWQDVTMADVTKRELARQATRTAQKPRSKYHAVKTTVDGIVFDSAKEAKRYRELLSLGTLGYVRNLEIQPSFSLRVNDGVFPGATWTVVIGRYVADFRYETRDHFDAPWEDVIEDVKGFKTPLYRWKRKHVEAQYGITIHEI